jgi:hypothetical protein
MPSVGVTSSSPSATSHRQKRRIPRSLVAKVDASGVSASQVVIACRLSSLSTASRPRSVSQRLK